MPSSIKVMETRAKRMTSTNAIAPLSVAVLASLLLAPGSQTRASPPTRMHRQGRRLLAEGAYPESTNTSPANDEIDGETTTK